MSTYILTDDLCNTVQQCQPCATPGNKLGKPSHGRRPGAPHNHNSMHIAILCNKSFSKLMPRYLQELRRNGIM